MSSNFPFTKFFIRQGHPDFLDLPWEYPLAEWIDKCSRIVEVEKGISRHLVVFVSYREIIYAIKELPFYAGEQEYRILREFEKRKLPSVKPVGYGTFRDSENSALITQFLESSLPYRSLFMKPGLERYQDRLLNTIAMLLVQLHIKGVFWGDCSLSNTLFRRDIGELQAYLVDAETSRAYPSLSEGQREHDLLIMEENVSGELMDLSMILKLPESLDDFFSIGTKIRGRYEHLWDELTKDETFDKHEWYRIHDRIKRINDLGFTVDEVEIITTENGNKLHMKPFVTDRNYHQTHLHTLTGIFAEEKQARQILNEIYELKATLSKKIKREISIHRVVFQWNNENYLPTIKELGLLNNSAKAPEIYCEVLEHKWFLSEKANRDIGLKMAVKDYIQKYMPL
ncbi:MAG: DUF4032 domain-containing protein [Candidatus Thorarchaeota archaeon]